jgi:EmrB/QacA subfamily drug resistance transporter
MNATAAIASKQASPNSILFVIGTVLFFGVINASAIMVMLPSIGIELALNPTQLGWIMSGSLLMYGVAIPFYGRFSDRFGTKRLLLMGIGLFSVGSLLAALAPSFATIMIARLIQAVGGAAFPGLGMAIASRAFPLEERGKALGILSATMGVGAAIGPLLAGVVSDLLDWRYLFAISAMAIFLIPIGMKVFSRDEELSKAPIDILGGTFLALIIAGALFAVSQGSQSGWTSPLILTSLGLAIGGLIALIMRQRSLENPFIPKELLKNPKYLAVLVMGFCTTGVVLAASVSYPLVLNALHDLNPLQIGLVLAPAALATAILGVLAGRWFDRIGAQIPTRIGALLLLVGIFGLSSMIGSGIASILILATLMGAGFALLNTPFAAIISHLVPARILATALSMNTMIFFVGGGFGISFLMSVSSSSTATSSMNLLHIGEGIGFSDAFLFLIVPILVISILTALLPKLQPTVHESPDKELAQDEVHADAVPQEWKPDCTIPWAPGCQESEELRETQTTS